MSLKEAYTMAHSAKCRLHMEADRPERNLRFVVGHLMHYESLRLRIVEIEHDISKNERAKAVAFKGTGHVSKPETGLRKISSSGQLAGRRSPPPPADYVYGDEENDDNDEDDDDPWSGGDDEDEDEESLGLQRFPSGSSRPPRPAPGLLPDEEGDDDDDPEPISPEEPDQATLEAIIKGAGNTDMANMYNGMTKCVCHKKQDAPQFENFWELPVKDGAEGRTRAIAQVRV